MAKKRDIDIGVFTIIMKAKNRAVCLVCDMIVSKETHFKTVFKGKRYYFCCNDCKSSFTKNPYKYTLG